MGSGSLLAILVLLCSQGEVVLCCTPAPVWLYSDPEDIRTLFNDLEGALKLVSEGVPEAVIRQSETGFQIAIPEDIVEMPVIWFLLSKQYKELKYSVELTSRNLSSVIPALTIPPTGTITDPYRFRMLFYCSSPNDGQRVGMIFKINITSLTGFDFCPIEFFFSKVCFHEGPTLAPDELPTGLQNIGIADGFLDKEDVSLIVDTDTAPAEQEGLVSIILKAVLIPLCIIVSVASVVIVMIWVRWYWRSKMTIADFHPEAVSRAYKTVYTSDIVRGQHNKEFPLERLMIIRALGEGAFGMVSQGVAEGIEEGSEWTDVAVKQLRYGSAEADEFFKEVDFMTGLDHPNIVNLLGVCSLKEPFSMIFEYMDLGDLRSFLRDAIGLGNNMNTECLTNDFFEPLLTNQELITIALQVAKGMEYISSKRLVHRDLAARNCLVATGLVVKIADFGMSRSIESTDYYKVKEGATMLPVRWMPPESILYGKFTIQSDIWAFGVLLWEIFTFGQQPYFGLNNEQVVLRVKEGKHPTSPTDCPAHHLMMQCWSHNPKKRPSFEECRKQIQQLLDNWPFSLPSVV